MLGERRAFGAILDKYSEEFEKIFVMTGDLKSSCGLDRFAANNPEKFLSAGIAEQNMVGIASGLASDDDRVFVTSFTPFITGRCYDQVRMHLGYMHHNVALVGLAGGIGVGIQGNSHYGLDDVALMRAIPGMTIIEPADCVEVAKAIQAIYHYQGPVYLRLIGEQNTPIIYKEDYDFQIGKAIKLRDGSDITIFAAGSMVIQALKTANMLSEKGIDVEVINMHTIKPLDIQVIDSAKDKKLLVALEEHNVVGGLGSAIAEYISDKHFAPLSIFGVPDIFPHAGTYPYMLNELGLDAEHIAEKIAQKLANV